MQEHRGHVELNGVRLGATLHWIEDRPRLEVAEPGGGIDVLPGQVDLAHFRSSTGVFSLLGLRQMRSQIRLGVGGTITYHLRLALEGALFPSLKDICSTRWTVYVEDLPSILHVTGLEHSMTFYSDDEVTLQWTLSAPPLVPLACGEAGLEVALGQDIETDPDRISALSVRFRYPAIIIFPTPVTLDTALPVIRGLQQLFSLLMGRVLGIDQAGLTLSPTDQGQMVTLHGLVGTRRTEFPAQKLVAFDGALGLAGLLDRWLVRADGLADAVTLHFQALEQHDLEPALRFQLFIQAIEAAHRRSAPPAEPVIAVAPILEVLRARGLASDVVDRVGGILAHAHEPGLRQRLKHYWDLFAAELAVLRPNLTRKAAIAGLAATRNFYAHRTDLTDQVLQGSALWNATELVKAISHLVLLRAIDAEIAGVGQAMITNSFVQFAYPENQP